MVCTPANSCTEWEFVASLPSRARWDDCRGPFVRLAFRPLRLQLLERIFASESASDVLWCGYTPGGITETRFTLCVAHWIDLATLVFARGRQLLRFDYEHKARELLGDVCTGAGWDPKEIANSLAWQRTRLT